MSAAAERWRVALVTTFYPPFHHGGDAIAVRNLAGALARRGHDVTVVHDTDGYRALAGEPSEAARQEAAASAPPGVRVVALRTRSPALSTLVTQQTGQPGLKRAALEAALAGPFDVIHYHNVSLVGGPATLAMGRATVKLYTAHEHWLVCPTHVLWRHGREPCETRQCVRCTLRAHRPPQLWRRPETMDDALRAVDVVIAQSAFSRDRHRSFGLRRAMEVLPQFLPPAPPRADAGTDDPRPYVLFVGRLEAMKGLADVVPLFRGDGGCGGAELRIVGDGPQRAALERLAAGSGRVRFLGRLGGAALDAQYRGAAAVVVPALGYETFGLVVIEAFRCGVPVVVRRRGPLPELLDESGGGLAFDTAEELERALARLVGDPVLRRTLGARGAAAFATRWSEAAVLPRYEALVSAALARRRGGVRVPEGVPEGVPGIAAAMRAARPRQGAVLEAACAPC